jgi:hypothetical protein
MPRDPLAESISSRLLRAARAANVDYQVVLRRYALEQVLLRLAGSRHRDSFVMKGAFLFYAWGGEPFRTTQDLDLLGTGENSPVRIAGVFGEILSLPVEPSDGLVFDQQSLRVEAIREAERYEGLRVKALAVLGKSRITITIDIGFGDAVTPAPTRLEFPALLKTATISIAAYPPEAVIAEKLEAMVSLERYNSRMKAFFDVWALSQTNAFGMRALVTSVYSTFQRRHTAISNEVPDCLSDAFYRDSMKQAQWNGFLLRSNLTRRPPQFFDLGTALRGFAWPVLTAAKQPGEPASLHWPAGGPWGP